MPILHWLTRNEDIGAASRAPYRLLKEVPELSAGDPEVALSAQAGNTLIQGDSPEALTQLHTNRDAKYKGLSHV